MFYFKKNSYGILKEKTDVPLLFIFLEPISSGGLKIYTLGYLNFRSAHL